jgi:NAD(P)H-flavin reductase
MLFKEDIARWLTKFKVHLTVDTPDKSWKFNTGVVTKLLESGNLTNDKKIVVACGPPMMIKFSLQTLQNIGFHDDQIYVSFERLMKCGIGKCGHCMIKGIYVCKDGPVFRFDKISVVRE